jgi:putative hydrolase of the HAD superfamily
VTKAVVFDLWETLADWSHEDMAPLYGAVGLTEEEWRAADHAERRWTGSFEGYLEWLGLDVEASAAAAEIRRAMTRRALVPVEGALPVLAELRDRGLALGLISNCSSEVGELWHGSPFGGAFDAVVLSADVGFCKPEARIYRLALERLGVEPGEAVFVGDGHSDELAGAEAIGMRAIQIGSYHPWEGERIESIPGLLELV